MSAATLPAVSVILPIYGVEKFLPACLARHKLLRTMS